MGPTAADLIRPSPVRPILGRPCAAPMHVGYVFGHGKSTTGGTVTTQTTATITDPTPTVPATDTDRRLERIAEQHTPYAEHAEESTGLMCRECGYLDPCPTRRMTFTATDLAGPWLVTDQ